MLHRRTKRNQSRVTTSLWLSALCAAAALNLALGAHDHAAHDDAPEQITAHVSPIDAALCLIRQLLGIPCDYDPSDTDDTPGPPPPPMPDEPVT